MTGITGGGLAEWAAHGNLPPRAVKHIPIWIVIAKPFLRDGAV